MKASKQKKRESRRKSKPGGARGQPGHQPHDSTPLRTCQGKMKTRTRMIVRKRKKMEVMAQVQGKRSGRGEARPRKQKESQEQPRESLRCCC